MTRASGHAWTVLRDAAWLDGRRARHYALLLAAMTWGLALWWGLTATDGIDRNGRPIGTDFLAFWSASRLALSGAATGAYDLARIGAAERAAMPVDPGLSSFLYPPPFLLACLPLGLLSYWHALVLWLGVTGAGYWCAVRQWTGRVAPWWLLFAFPAVLANIGHGQNGFLTAALLGGGLVAAERRPVLAGVLLGALVMKPQVALTVPVLLLVTGRWRVLGVAALTVATLAAAATAILGTAIWPAFLAGSAVGRAILDQGLVEPGKMVSLYAAVRVLGGGAGLGYAVQALGACAGLAAVVMGARAGGNWRGQAALTVAAGALVSPFLLDYDLTLLAVPLAWLWRKDLDEGFAPWDRLILAIAFLLPLIARPLALNLGIPIAPLVIGALVVSLWRAQHRHAAAGAVSARPALATA